MYRRQVDLDFFKFFGVDQKSLSRPFKLIVSMGKFRKKCIFSFYRRHLVLRLLLTVGEESPETDAGDLDDLETNTGNISLGLTLTTESRDEDLVVLINVCEGTVPWDEGGDLLSVLDQLDSDGLTNGRVRLLSLNTKTLNNNTLGVGSSS
jgi:hypothetical protein